MARQQIIGELFDYDRQKRRFGTTGTTLGDCIAETSNGIDLPLDTPQGDVRMISLAPFIDQSPELFLVFTFIESNDGFDDLDHGNAVVLDEYELAADRPEPEITPWNDYDPEAAFPEYRLPPGAKMITLKPDLPDK
jgi:hypothetical protein